MPSPPGSVGRLLARLTGHGDMRGWATGGDPAMVPLTLRQTTVDGEDVRLLLELWMRPVQPTPAAEPDRLAYTAVAPAVSRWVAGHRLGDLSAALGDQAIDEEARHILRGLGAELVRVEVVAIEHLLLSPSADPASDHGSW